jgi:hypothetical protein
MTPWQVAWSDPPHTLFALFMAVFVPGVNLLVSLWLLISANRALRRKRHAVD